VVAVAAASLLIGCGGGSDAPTGGTPSARNTDERSALLAVARCMRTNGYPAFPDPVEDEHGGWGFPASAQDHRKAPAACTQLVRRAKSGGNRGEDAKQLSAADVAKARSFARCMREQGLADWPDPDASGTFNLPARFHTPNAKRLLLAQERACRQYMPGKGIRVTGPPQSQGGQ
jgi:hypothetical protein